jgi:hypothetical protein
VFRIDKEGQVEAMLLCCPTGEDCRIVSLFNRFPDLWPGHSFKDDLFRHVLFLRYRDVRFIVNGSVLPGDKAYGVEALPVLGFHHFDVFPS